MTKGRQEIEDRQRTLRNIKELKKKNNGVDSLTNQWSAKATEDRRTDVTPPRYFYCQRNLYTSTFIL